MHEQAGYAIKYHVVVILPTRAEQFKQQYKKQKTKTTKTTTRRTSITRGMLRGLAICLLSSPRRGRTNLRLF